MTDLKIKYKMNLHSLYVAYTSISFVYLSDEHQISTWHSRTGLCSIYMRPIMSSMTIYKQRVLRIDAVTKQNFTAIDIFLMFQLARNEGLGSDAPECQLNEADAAYQQASNLEAWQPKS